MKAYKTDSGRILLFRPEKNAERAAKGCTRLSMPEIPRNIFLEAVECVVQDNADYIPPTEKGAFLFARGPAGNSLPAAWPLKTDSF